MVSGNNHCVMSIDVEDWFHILDLPSTPGLDQWDRLPSRVERNFMRLLDLAAERRVRRTLSLPRPDRQLSSATGDRGGRAPPRNRALTLDWAHRVAYEAHTQRVLRRCCESQGCTRANLWTPRPWILVSWIRSPIRNAWAFDELLRAGYSYDASVFPSCRAHGGWRNGQYSPYISKAANGELVEFPTSVEEGSGTRMVSSGAATFACSRLQSSEE